MADNTDSVPVEEQAGDPLDEMIAKAIDGEEEAEASESEGVEDEATPPEEGVVEDVEPPPVIDAPQDWRADQRERFAKLPDEAKSLVLEQYKDFQGGFTRKSQELSEQARYAEAVRSVITDDHRRQLALAGMDEIGGIKRLVALNDMATRDPAGYMRWFIQQAGIQPEQLIPLAEVQDEYIDPTVAKLQKELSELKNGWQQFANAQQQSAWSSAVSYIQAFAAAVDEAGNPTHPHVNRVADTMTALLSSAPRDRMGNPALSLEDAYQRAVRADPELYGEALKAAEQKALAKVESERKAAVDKAKKAGRHGVSGAPPGKGEAKPSSLDALIEQAMDAAGVS